MATQTAQTRDPTTYLVEHFWPGVTADRFQVVAARVRASADEMAREGAVISFLHSTMVPADESAFCVFDAASPRIVAEAYERAGVQYERVVYAIEMERGGPERT